MGTSSSSQAVDCHLLKNHPYNNLLNSIMEFDGVYKLRTFSDDFFTLMKTIGLPEADIKLAMHPKNIMSLTLMKNKDKSITYIHEMTMAPNMNFTVTLKIGETVELKKPIPFRITLLKIEHDELHMKMEAHGKTIMRKILLNNFGLTMVTTMEEEDLMVKAIYDRISPDITGYYEMDREENLLLFLQQTFPNITADILERMKLRGMGMTLKKEDTITMTRFFLEEEKKTVIYKRGEPVEYKIMIAGTEVEETRVLTKIAPGEYKMICKSKTTGKVVEKEYIFTENAFTMVAKVAGIKATVFYKRCPDVEGIWKVVTKEGEGSFIDACGIPEPKKTEMMTSLDCHHMMRLGYSKLWLKTNSKLLPEELTMKLGENFECHLKHLGKATGIATEINKTLMVCLKIGVMTINIKEKVSGDFMIMECDVDGNLMTKMKMVMIRE